MPQNNTYPQFKAVADPANEANAPANTYRGAIVSLKGLPYSAIASEAGIVSTVVSSIDNPILPNDDANSALITASAIFAKQWNVGDPRYETVHFYAPNSTIPFEGDIDLELRALVTLGLAYAYDGDGNARRLLLANEINQSAATKSASLQVAMPGTWSVTHAPATNVRATISRAAGGASVRHICTAITATLIAPAATESSVVQLNLRDGATGAGTILKSFTLQVGGAASVSADRAIIQLSGLQCFGALNTAMTLEFSAAGGAGTFESVSMEGYDVG